jgi:phosphoglycerate dehydrogenase-like enzyme
MSATRVLLVEDDAYPRVLRVILDPKSPDDLRAAFAQMIAHELPDFDGWCSQLRAEVPALYPCEVRMVKSQEELRTQLSDADAVMVESLLIGQDELARAPRLRVVQKYGAVLDNIDTAACAERGVSVRTLRRRANAACAEHALAMMLMLARQLHKINGLISIEQLKAAGFAPAVGADAYDPRVPGSGWARVTPLRILRDSTLGIVGLGEIGRELALRAAAFGMRVVYTQRHRLHENEEREFSASFLPLDALLAESDWVSLHVPETAATRGMIGAAQLAMMKRGAGLINVARARLVDRGALIAALESGQLGGCALDAQYEEPGRADDELLQFDNVILTPHTAAQPRTIGLEDFREVIFGIAQALSA